MNNVYLKGEILYGDNFNFDSVKKWYSEESEGYSDLGSFDRENYKYFYHQLNLIHGFDKLPKKVFENVLGFGSAWGDEFIPIAGNIKKLTIIEPSLLMRSDKVEHIKPEYITPEISGVILLPDNSFDLITCFGTLHHIPNVSFVIKELIRVLKPDGYLLIREPIISMGDWNLHRKGLTKNERGIPVNIFENIFNQHNVKCISKSYCFTITSHLNKIWNKFFSMPIYSYGWYIKIDKIISELLIFNIRYHAISPLQRISPSNVFYIISKNNAND